MNSARPSGSETADHRHASRTHLFVIATLCWGEGSTPVHVRNMSRKGAQINLGNALSADVILVATHPEIQSLDISLQRIERIIGALGRAKLISK